jgi:hypothetical protein
MANEFFFQDCIHALDEVAHAFFDSRRGLPAPTKYEADLAAFKLMEVVFQHVNAVKQIAALDKPGSHYVSAWVLLRSTFEVALTAYWLVIDDDWQEREARWLGWMAGEEDFQRRLAGDIRPLNEEGSRRLLLYAEELKRRRIEISGLLPIDSREKRPNIAEMLQKCGIEKEYYIAYRVGSQLTHGGPTVCEEVFDTGENFIRVKEIGNDAWINLFLMASWSLAKPGHVVLRRAGASDHSAKALLAKHDKLRDVVKKLGN